MTASLYLDKAVLAQRGGGAVKAHCINGEDPNTNSDEYEGHFLCRLHHAPM